MDLSELWLIPLGAGVGAFGTIVGAGGGFILVPILLFLYPDEKPKEITSISLVVVCANSVSGSVAYALQKRIDYRSGLWFATGALPGSVAGAILVGFVPRRLFDALFALTLGSIGLWMLLRRFPNSIRNPVTGRGVVRRIQRDSSGQTFFYSFHLYRGVAISLVVGFVSSLLGIGGGVLQVPILAIVLHFPVHIATATSQFVLMFMSGQANLTHIATGSLGWDSTLVKAALLSAGAVPGAQLGAMIARRLRSVLILRALAASLVLVSLRLGLKAATG